MPDFYTIQDVLSFAIRLEQASQEFYQQLSRKAHNRSVSRFLVSLVTEEQLHDAANVTKTRRYLERAFESQMKGEGFSFVEILTMCPTGWFVSTPEGPGSLDEVLGSVHVTGELKVGGELQTTGV